MVHHINGLDSREGPASTKAELFGVRRGETTGDHSECTSMKKKNSWQLEEWVVSGLGFLVVSRLWSAVCSLLHLLAYKGRVYANRYHLRMCLGLGTGVIMITDDSWTFSAL